MAQERESKLWQPARFTHGGVHGSGDERFGPNSFGQHTVIILNNPLENKELLADVCIKGMLHFKASYL